MAGCSRPHILHLLLSLSSASPLSFNLSASQSSSTISLLTSYPLLTRFPIQHCHQLEAQTQGPPCGSSSPSGHLACMPSLITSSLSSAHLQCSSSHRLCVKTPSVPTVIRALLSPLLSTATIPGLQSGEFIIAVLWVNTSTSLSFPEVCFVRRAGVFLHHQVSLAIKFPSPSSFLQSSCYG
jgi:hypothetical protein